MKTYQTLSLIGCIIGIFLMLGLLAFVGTGIMFNDMVLNMTKTTGTTSEQTTQQKSHDVNEATFKPLSAGLVIGLFLFLVLIPITFIVKNTKAVGIVVIVLGVIAMAATNVFAVIPFALLLPAGILAIRYKHTPGLIGTRSSY